MDQTHTIARLATRVRLLCQALSEVSTALLDVERGKLASQSFDAEVKLIQLHDELIDLLRETPKLPLPKDPARVSGRDDLPF